MKKIKLITKEEALEIARARRGNHETPAGLFYGLLENANPAVVEYFEGQMATMIQLGTAMKQYISGLEPGTPEYKEAIREIQKISRQTSFSSAPDEGETEKEDEPQETDQTIKTDDGVCD